MLKLLNKLPIELYRYIYSYINDLSIIKLLKDKYVSKEDNNNVFKYYYQNRYIINDIYYWTRHYTVFPSIISAYWFHRGYTDVCDYAIYDDTERDDI